MAVKRKKTSRSAAVAAKGVSRGAKPAKRPVAKTAARKSAASVRKAAPVKSRASREPAPKLPPRKSPVTRLPAAKLPSMTVAAVKPRAAQSKSAQDAIVKTVEAALDDMKAVNIKVLDVRKLTDIADTLVIASGNSDRHVRSIADRVIQFAKRDGFRPTGVEGERDGEWVLVDLRDVIVHIMLPRIREFYRLEDLWDVSAARREAAAVAAEK